MKLLLAIISNDDARGCTSALNKASYRVTKLATTGGFLSNGNTTLIVGCQDEQVDDVIAIIGKESSRRKEIIMNTSPSEMASLISIPMEVEVGGATIFVLDVDKFVTL